MADVMRTLVACKCETRWDSAQLAQCPSCGTTLAELDEGVGPEKTRIDLVVDGVRHTLAAGAQLLLGRDDDYPAEASFRAHTNVSRRHAIVRFDGERLFVIDTDSRNGTFVDGVRIASGPEHELRPGQQLRLAADVPIEIVREP